MTDTSSNTILSPSIWSPWIFQEWSSWMILGLTPLSPSISSPWLSEECSSWMIIRVTTSFHLPVGLLGYPKNEVHQWYSLSNATSTFHLICLYIWRMNFVNDSSSQTTFTFYLISLDTQRMKIISDTSSNTTFTFRLISLDIIRMKFINDTSSNTAFTFHLIISEERSSSMILRVTPLSPSNWSR